MLRGNPHEEIRNAPDQPPSLLDSLRLRHHRGPDLLLLTRLHKRDVEDSQMLDISLRGADSLQHIVEGR